MGNKLNMNVAAATLLILGSVGASAGEPDFRAPTTDRAQQTQPLLARAAQALNAEAVQAGQQHIANLWLFPTSDEDTVFAQYVVTGGRTASNAAGTQTHLEVLRLRGNRIVEQSDLTQVADDGGAYAKRPSAGLDRTALIGTGHAASSPDTSITAHGSPASPHWTTLIGTGHVSGESSQRSQTVASRQASQAPAQHWTSKIGTGHAADTNSSAQEQEPRETTSSATSVVGS